LQSRDRQPQDLLMALGGVGCLLRYQLMMLETTKES
jgi:hypothetical protein